MFLFGVFGVFGLSLLVLLCIHLHIMAIVFLLFFTVQFDHLH